MLSLQNSNILLINGLQANMASLEVGQHRLEHRLSRMETPMDTLEKTTNDQGKTKIKSFVDNVTKNFCLHFYPYECLFLDEMVIGFKGRFRSRQYNSKNHTCTISRHSACETPSQVTASIF